MKKFWNNRTRRWVVAFIFLAVFIPWIVFFTKVPLLLSVIREVMTDHVESPVAELLRQRGVKTVMEYNTFKAQLTSKQIDPKDLKMAVLDSLDHKRAVLLTFKDADRNPILTVVPAGEKTFDDDMDAAGLGLFAADSCGLQRGLSRFMLMKLLTEPFYLFTPESKEE